MADASKVPLHKLLKKKESFKRKRVTHWLDIMTDLTSGSGLHEIHPIMSVLAAHCPHDVFTHLVQSQSIRAAVFDGAIPN